MLSLVNVDLVQLKALLYRWLVKQLSQEQLSWLEENLTPIAEGRSDRFFSTTFSSIPRRLGKQDVCLTIADYEAAMALRPGWSPTGWSLDQVGRSLLLLTLPSSDANAYGATVDTLFSLADVSELVTLYQSLPILPHPELHLNHAQEGIRSNITAVFNAIALQNPYPANYFDISAWNQMILKAIFIGSPLHLIWHLDQRANPELARMVSDYAHERWAAGRSVTPEVWRLIGPFLNARLIADIEYALHESDRVQQLAAALACSQSSLPQAQSLLTHYPELQHDIESEQLTWERFSQKYVASVNGYSPFQLNGILNEIQGVQGAVPPV